MRLAPDLRHSVLIATETLRMRQTPQKMRKVVAIACLRVGRMI